jgi:trehalose synthase
MITLIEPDESFSLDHFASIAHLADSVRELRAEASMLIPKLKGRTLWMINSTAQGGGVAEMLPMMVSLLEELGLPTRWVVIGTDKQEYFALTKRLHNLIHGHGEPQLDGADRELYEAVNRENAEDLKKHLKPEDILVVHDPQPAALGAMLKEELDMLTIWRCHIGLDDRLPATRAAWIFLKPYAATYNHAVFSAPEYIPDYLAGYSTIIHPALDPCSHKNRELSPHKLVGILCNSSLKVEREPVLTPPFSKPAMRLRGDGSWVQATALGGIGLLYRTTVTQISRWDRLKGYRPLMEGFLKLKMRLNDLDRKWDPRHRRRIGIARLVLGGPDPAFIQDDPEGKEVLQELIDFYCRLTPEYQNDIALLTLPMDSRKENALMVNALQRCSTIIVQNSTREGFGLTATEAMWKRVPILGTYACGLRQQIRHGIDGMLTRDPNNPDEIADNLNALLEAPVERDLLARTAQRRVHQEFLIFAQLRHWLRLLAECVQAPTLQREVTRSSLRKLK